MKSKEGGKPQSIADPEKACVLASVEIEASPDRVFQALASEEIVKWWVRPGVFDTREWSGEVRVGGRWRASGMARGQHYTLEGEFLEVERPNKLVHTSHFAGASANATIVTYLLEEIDGGSRLTIRHSGFADPDSGANTSLRWETSLQQLVDILQAELYVEEE